MNIGTIRQKNQYVNSIIYLVVMAIFMFLIIPDVKSLFSSHSVIDIIRHSLAEFAYVHPMESPHIALFHFALYWLYIADQRSKLLRNLLFWHFLVETVSASMNEYSHLIEEQDVILFQNVIDLFSYHCICAIGLQVYVWAGCLAGMSSHHWRNQLMIPMLSRGYCLCQICHVDGASVVDEAVVRSSSHSRSPPHEHVGPYHCYGHATFHKATHLTVLPFPFPCQPRCQTFFRRPGLWSLHSTNGAKPLRSSWQTSSYLPFQSFS